jgi:hypothetical protein
MPKISSAFRILACRSLFLDIISANEIPLAARRSSVVSKRLGFTQFHWLTVSSIVRDGNVLRDCALWDRYIGHNSAK